MPTLSPLISIPIAIAATLAIARLTTPAGMTFQEWSWLATGIGVVISGLKALNDWGISRKQRADELRWKKSELAMKVLDAMHSDPRAKHALSMIDWSNHEYVLPNGTQANITWADVKKALRPETPGKLEFDAKEHFIRDSFDGLFDHIERIGHLVKIGLIEPEDVKHPLTYWAIRQLSGEIPELPDAVRQFMKYYRYTLGLALLEEFNASRGERSA